METPWKPIATAPKDGTQVLLAKVEADGTYGIRHGFFEKGVADRCWYDIDGYDIDPQFWMPAPIPPGGKD